MKIEYINVTKPFMYIWLKEVLDIDLNVHCAKCLIGNYDNRISSKIKNCSDLPLNGDIYYLCGVSLPYNWNKNFHLAFKKNDAKDLYYNDNGIEVKIVGAERIEFSQLDVDYNLKNASKKEFYTCRNWQFANKLNRIKKMEK